MSFAESIAALRNLFKVSAELPLAAAVDEAGRGGGAVRDHYYVSML